MTLNRLTSTTQQYSRESVARAKSAAGERQRRVEAAEGVEGDRQRSLQQELADTDPKMPESPEAAARMLRNARVLAAQLRGLGRGADALIKAPAVPTGSAAVDDTA